MTTASAPFRRDSVLVPLFLLLGLLAALPARAGLDIQHWVAATGARVYFIETRVLPIIDVQIDFPAGGKYAPAGKAGVAGLTQGLLDAGAAGLNEEQLAERLVDTGARLGGGADSDRANLTLRTLSAPAQREAALDLMRTVLLSPTFPADVIEREKQRTIAGLRDADTRPASIAARRFAAALYPGHPYGVMPTAESVAAISREDLVTFHRTRYVAGDAVVSIIGDLSRDEADAIVRRLTEGLPRSAPAAALPAITRPPKATVTVDHPATQSHIQIGLPAIARDHPDYFPLIVGNYILGGGGFVSRLMKEVREKRGFAYSVHSAFSPRQQEGPFEIGLQTRRDQAREAIRTAESVLGDFLRDGPTPAEVAAAKKYYVDSLALRLDSNAKLLGYLSTIGFYRLPLTYIEDFPARIRAVTAAQIRDAFARHVRPEHLVTVIVAGE